MINCAIVLTIASTVQTCLQRPFQHTRVHFYFLYESNFAACNIITKFLLAVCLVFAMVGMKASVSSVSSGKKPTPIRRPCPEIDMEELKEKFHGYVEKVGSKEAFNLYAYNNLPVSNAVDGYSMLKKEQLVVLLIQVSPLGMIKFSHLRDGCKYLEDTFGKELFSCFTASAPLLAGKVADQLFVLLAHVRRVMGNMDRWTEAFARFNIHHLAGLKNLQGFMAEHGFEVKTTKSKEPDSPTVTPLKLRKLGVQISDVSVDSFGFANIPRMDAKSPDPEVQLLHEESPTPLKKRPAAATPMKRPAAVTIKKHKGVIAMKAESSCVKQVDFKINIGTLVVAGGKDQSYVQHVPKGSSKKQLVVAVSKSMTHEHRKLIDKIHGWILKQSGPSKMEVVNYRNKLLS